MTILDKVASEVMISRDELVRDYCPGEFIKNERVNCHLVNYDGDHCKRHWSMETEVEE